MGRCPGHVLRIGLATSRRNRALALFSHWKQDNAALSIQHLKPKSRLPESATATAFHYVPQKTTPCNIAWTRDVDLNLPSEIYENLFESLFEEFFLISNRFSKRDSYQRIRNQNVNFKAPLITKISMIIYFFTVCPRSGERSTD